MARIKQADAGRSERPNVRLPIDVILRGPRPSDPEADRVWRAARQRLFQAEHCHPQFDPRRLLGLSTSKAAQWREARRAWALEVLADFVCEEE